MDGPAYGHQVDPYQVLLILKDGSARVYAAYGNEAAPVPAHTDHTADTPANNTPAQEHTKSEETPEGWAQGNIRRINLLQGKLTLRHGPLPTVDMPPMTMVFGVRDRTALDALRVGDDIEFRVTKDPAGKLLITDIRRR